MLVSKRNGQPTPCDEFKLVLSKIFWRFQAEPLIGEALCNRVWHCSIELTRLPSYFNDRSLYCRLFFWFCRNILWLLTGVRSSNVNYLSCFVLNFFFALMPISTWLFLEKEHIILYCHYSCNPATKRQSHWFDWSARVYPFSLHVHKCSRGRCIGRCKSFVTELLTSACRKRFYKFWLPQCLDIGSVWSTVVDIRPATLVATFFFFFQQSVCVWECVRLLMFSSWNDAM